MKNKALLFGATSANLTPKYYLLLSPTGSRFGPPVKDLGQFQK